MRIELDKPLTKTKLRQVLKMIGNDAKKIKIIMGTEVFDIDTIVSKNDTMYLCTDSKETSKFYEKRVVKESSDDEEKEEDDYCDPRVWRYPNHYYTITHNEKYWAEWEKYRREHGLPPNYVGDTPGFGDDITCSND